MTRDLEQPLRYPDTASTQVMNKRARWLVLLGFIFPGSAQMLAGNRKLGRVGITATVLFILGIIAALLWAMTNRGGLGDALLTNRALQLAMPIVLTAYAVLWVVLGIDTLRLAKLVHLGGVSKIGIVVLSAVLTLVPAIGAAWVGNTAIRSTVQFVSDAFPNRPAFDPVDGRYNILLLGTDAGDDREGLRPDSISLLSVDADTGEAIIVGLPRELKFMPFPEDSPMHAIHPNGFCAAPNAFGDYGGCLTTGYLNAIYAEVEQADEIVESEALPQTYADFYDGMYPDALNDWSTPGIEAIKDAVTGATGLEVQAYVLINMDAFSSMIDALGGVEIDVKERLPIGGNENGEGITGYLEPGLQKLDGFHAQWYARSRYGSEKGDYSRMERQRELQAAILAQMTPQTVLTKLGPILSAGAELLETDIPRTMVDDFGGLALKAKAHGFVNVELVPPQVSADDPDYAVVRQLVADGIAEAAAAAAAGGAAG